MSGQTRPAALKQEPENVATRYRALHQGGRCFIDWLDATTGGVAALGEIAV